MVLLGLLILFSSGMLSGVASRVLSDIGVMLSTPSYPKTTLSSRLCETRKSSQRSQELSSGAKPSHWTRTSLSEGETEVSHFQSRMESGTKRGWSSAVDGGSRLGSQVLVLDVASEGKRGIMDESGMTPVNATCTQRVWYVPPPEKGQNIILIIWYEPGPQMFGNADEAWRKPNLPKKIEHPDDACLRWVSWPLELCVTGVVEQRAKYLCLSTLYQ